MTYYYNTELFTESRIARCMYSAAVPFVFMRRPIPEIRGYESSIRYDFAHVALWISLHSMEYSIGSAEYNRPHLLLGVAKIPLASTAGIRS